MASSHPKDAELLAKINHAAWFNEADEDFPVMECFDGAMTEVEADARWEYEKTLTDPETKRKYEKALADLDDEGKPWQ